MIDAHTKKVKKLCIHQRNELIYSMGEDKRISVSSLVDVNDQQKALTSIKCSNFNPKTMAIHQDLNRLYVSMKEKFIFLFDISDITPIVLFTVPIPYICKRMNIDHKINDLQCLMENGRVISL